MLGKLVVEKLSLYRVLDQSRSWSIPGMSVIAGACGKKKRTTAVAADFEAILR